MSTIITAALVLGVNANDLFCDDEDFYEFMAQNNLDTDVYDYYPPYYDASFSDSILGIKLINEYQSIDLMSEFPSLVDKIEYLSMRFSGDFNVFPRLIVTPIVY